MIRNKLIYLLLLASLTLLAILYNEYVMMVILLSFAGLPIVLLGCGLWLRSRLIIDISISSEMPERDAPFQVMIAVENKSLLPMAEIRIPMHYRSNRTPEVLKEEFLLSMEGRRRRVICCDVRGEHCGYLEFKLVKVKLRDALGIWSVRCKCRTSRVQTVVMPKVQKQPELSLAQELKDNPEQEEFSENKSGDDASEVFDIRGYRDGDRRNRIHWKLSIKERQLMVKEFGLPLDQETLLLVDFRKYEGEQGLRAFDITLDALCSISSYLTENGFRHDVMWAEKEAENVKKARIREESDIYMLLSELLIYFPGDDTVSLLSLQDAYETGESYANCIYISPEIDELEFEGWISRHQGMKVFRADIEASEGTWHFHDEEGEK